MAVATALIPPWTPVSVPSAQYSSDLATALDLGEARAVLAAAAHVRNAARWTVALALGLRQSEALALQWKDVDLLNNTLTVRRSIHRVRGGGLIYKEPKSADQKPRQVPLQYYCVCCARPPGSSYAQRTASKA